MSRRPTSLRGVTHYASVYPLVTTRALARPFTYEVPEDVVRGDVVSVRLGGARQRGVVIELEDSPPDGVEAAPIERVVESLPAPLVELRSVARGLLRLDAWSCARARRAAEARAAQGASAAGRAGLAAGRSGAERADRFPGACAGAPAWRVRRRRPLPALRRHREREDRGLPASGGRGAAPRPGRDRPRSRDRARAADRGPLSRAVRRSSGHPALVADRGGAPRRARADRLRRGADRDRSALRDLRAAAPGRA